MSMPLGFSVKVSLFSMRRRLIRTTLSLIPCILLIAIMFIGSTIPNGLVTQLDEQVLKNAESRQEIVILDPYLFNQPDTSLPEVTYKTDTEFNEQNYELATTSPLVKDVYPQLGGVQGTANKIGNISRASLWLGGTSPEFAQLYTDQKFQYIPGQPIPVLINPGSISSQSYNWEGKDTLVIDHANAEDTKNKMLFTQLENSKELVGKTFTAEFGAFPAYPEAFEEHTGGSFAPPKATLTKLSTEDISILDKRITEWYGPYWDINALRRPVTFEFVVTGVITGQNSTEQGYVPNEAVVAIWNDLYLRQQNARTTKPLDTSFLEDEELKSVVKENVINNPLASFSYPTPTWTKESSVSAWQIPLSNVGVGGLLVEPTKTARGDVTYKEYIAENINSENFQPRSAIVRLNSPDARTEYIKFLTDNGMRMFDSSPLSVIRSLRNGSKMFVTWLTIILGGVVALILVTTVSRFVADSRREIGVWRAIGATQLDISKLILTRISILLAIGIGVGVLLGLAASVLIANTVANQFASATSGFNPFTSQGFLSGMIISQLGGVVPEIKAMQLLAPDLQLLGTRLGLLTMITLFISLLPAWRAARISPVTAIRDSD